MSKANIVETIPTAGGIILGFQTRSGETLFYKYGPAASLALAAGNDPADVDGEQISEEEADSARSTADSTGEEIANAIKSSIEDIAEDAAGIALL